MPRHGFSPLRAKKLRCWAVGVSLWSVGVSATPGHPHERYAQKAGSVSPRERAQAAPEESAVDPSRQDRAPAVSVEDNAQRRSSLHDFVNAVAATLEDRVRTESSPGGIQLELSHGRGIDRRKVEREFGVRLRNRLRAAGRLIPSAHAPLHAKLVLSDEQGRVWAVGVLEGGGFAAPLTFAESAPIDRELEMALGATQARGRRSWGIERLGTFPAGVLDIIVRPIRGDRLPELVVLFVDGLRLYRYAPGDARPTLVGEPIPFPESRSWPRVVGGHLAEGGPDEVLLSTSAGHFWQYSLTTGEWKKAGRPAVPVKQSRTVDGERVDVVWAKARAGTSLLYPPVLTRGGERVDGPATRGPWRELLAWPSEGGGWFWIDAEGVAQWSEANGRQPAFALSDRVGDRAVLVDLDGDRNVELITSSTSAPGESDLLTIYRVEQRREVASIVYRTPLSGGSITGMAEGDLDFDDIPDVVIVEEVSLSESVVWRLEYAP